MDEEKVHYELTKGGETSLGFIKEFFAWTDDDQKAAWSVVEQALRAAGAGPKPSRDKKSMAMRLDIENRLLANEHPSVALFRKRHFPEPPWFRQWLASPEHSTGPDYGCAFQKVLTRVWSVNYGKDSTPASTPGPKRHASIQLAKRPSPAVEADPETPSRIRESIEEQTPTAGLFGRNAVLAAPSLLGPWRPAQPSAVAGPSPQDTSSPQDVSSPPSSKRAKTAPSVDTEVGASIFSNDQRSLLARSNYYVWFAFHDARHGTSKLTLMLTTYGTIVGPLITGGGFSALEQSVTNKVREFVLFQSERIYEYSDRTISEGGLYFYDNMRQSRPVAIEEEDHLATAFMSGVEINKPHSANIIYTALGTNVLARVPAERRHGWTEEEFVVTLDGAHGPPSPGLVEAPLQDIDTTMTEEDGQSVSRPDDEPSQDDDYDPPDSDSSSDVSSSYKGSQQEPDEVDEEADEDDNTGINVAIDVSSRHISPRQAISTQAISALANSIEHLADTE